MSELHTAVVGDGNPVVLIHGSLATGTEEWSAQQPLADEGFRLVVADRRGYGKSPETDGEDFLRDAADIVELLDGGSHVVAHSYGCLGAMLAAAERPAATWSLTLLEPPVFAMTADPAAEELVDAIRAMWDIETPDDEWLVRFLQAVGTDPDVIPPEARDEVVGMVPLVRRGRPAWDYAPPLKALSATPFPKLVVSGGHNQGFEAICDELAGGIDASRAVVEGAGHEIQFTGQPLNEMLLDLWRTGTPRHTDEPSGEEPAARLEGSTREARTRAVGMGTPPHRDEPLGEEPERWSGPASIR